MEVETNVWKEGVREEMQARGAPVWERRRLMTLSKFVRYCWGVVRVCVEPVWAATAEAKAMVRKV